MITGNPPGNDDALAESTWQQMPLMGPHQHGTEHAYDIAGIWKLTLVEGLDTYTIVNVYRQSCEFVGPFLSSYDCDQSRGRDNIVDFTGYELPSTPETDCLPSIASMQMAWYL